MTKDSSGVAQLAPVETTSLNQKVYSQLRQALMAGKFRPGETLTLRGLASALGTSIMPARDAVLRLTAERALESFGRGVRVPLLDLQRLEDVTRFRMALEGDAAALAADRASPIEITRMEQAAGRVEKAGQGRNMDRFLLANQEFHFAVYRGAHSDLLQSMIETLWLQIGPHLARVAVSETSEIMEKVDLAAHDEVVDAIRRHDPEAARRAVWHDLRDSVDIYRPLQSPQLGPAQAKKRA
jgi:DNA-binding GntR family transcriptional regulator